MAYNKELVAGKLRRWEIYLKEYRLPAWDDIPNIGLYMEQIIALLKDCLDYLPPELKEEQFITAATINNYVSKKIMPAPIKKKYYRVHIAYLIIICSLKHCLSIPTLQTLIPMGLTEEEVKSIYTSYARRHRIAADYFICHVRSAAAGILDHVPDTEPFTSDTEALITVSAVVSGFARLLAEKLLLLDGKVVDENNSIEKETPVKQYTKKSNSEQ